MDSNRLTVLAVDAVEARWALADVLAEDVASAGLTGQLADAVVLTRVGAARTCWEVVETQKKRSSFREGSPIVGFDSH